ncbi:MAG: glycosyltransferase family 39 protein [Methanobacterium sp.]|uniref:hypothetical protein n=1 Tax=Methanobacterium sp. TaxID=2164 RepID=UPI003D65DE1D|nr:glycosyltransferase family 39 protein [Methanobacterium sp.]
MFKISKTIKEKTWIIILFAIFLFSFILDMYVLTRYNISYGRDGPFYDLQVLSIIQTGFPVSNDPPLAYYVLTPLVILTGNSFLGIKIGMALIGSLMAVPAFFLTETFSEKINMESKVPALLSAFLITVNAFYFQMIGDFMQNLVGVFFLLLLIYFAVKWFENTKEWKKYGVLTIILLVCSMFTHIYTGIMAVVLFLSILVISLVLKTYKTRKMQFFDIKILAALGFLIITGLAVLFAIYPLMFSKFTTVLSFMNNSSTNSSNMAMGGSISPLIFLTLPFLLGVFATISVLYNRLKKKTDIKNSLSNKTLLAGVYLVMAAVIIMLSTLPSIDSQYQSRFMGLAFVPIALIVPLGLKYIENWLSNRYPSKKGFKIALISIIAVVFAMSSFYTAAGTFSNLGPSISTDQYNSLVQIKANSIHDKIDPNGIILVNEYHTGYWVQCVLGMQVETGNITELQKKYPNRTIYAITLTENGQSQPKGDFNYSWNPLLPYSFPFGGITLNSQDKQNSGLPDHQDLNMKNNMTGPPSMSLGNKNGFNRSSSSPPGNFTGQNAGSMNKPGNNLNQDYSKYGTLISSENNIKVYKIS